MKKSFLPVLCLLLALLPFSSPAEMPGEEVELTFRMTSDAGEAAVVQIELAYDQDALERLTIDGRDANKPMLNDPGAFTAVFRIREDARPGAYPVSVKVIMALDGSNNVIQSPTYSAATVTIKHPPVDVSVYYYFGGEEEPRRQTVTLPAGAVSNVKADIPEGYVAVGKSSMRVSVSEDGKAEPEAVTFVLATCTPSPTPVPTPPPTPRPEERSQTDRNALIMEKLAEAGLAWPVDETALEAAENAAPDLARFLYVAFPGDLNNDRKVDAQDGELMEKYVQSLADGAKEGPDEEGIERLMNGDLDGDGLVTAEDQAELNARLECLLSPNAVTRDGFIMLRLKEEGLSWPVTEEELSAALERLPWLNGYLYTGLKGDLNGDEGIDVRDFVILQKVFQENDEVIVVCYANGDMDGDGEITSADLTLLREEVEK